MKFLYVLVFFYCQTLFAWGARGHEVITRVAVQLLEDACPKKCSHPFALKEQMLTYLANVPDSYWRGFPKNEILDLNAAHFIGLEWFHIPSHKSSIRFTLKDGKERALSNCAKGKLPADICRKLSSKSRLTDIYRAAGSSPFRIEQLSLVLENLLSRTPINDQTMIQAMLHAGILAHYVGDLANPMHTTIDYDGWQKNAGGLHWYFETHLVDAYNFTLDSHVYKKAKQILGKKVQETKASYLDLAFDLAKNSYQDLPELIETDKEKTRTKPSVIREDGLKIKAKRLANTQGLPHFSSLIVKRLATGATFLATLWKSAWLQAGKPDLSHYQSFDFVHAPKPIKVSFLKEN